MRLSGASFLNISCSHHLGWQVAELSKKLAETEEDRNNLEQMMENAAASRDLVDDRAAQLVLREQKVQELEDKVCSNVLLDDGV